jgi:hypothetical protein
MANLTEAANLHLCFQFNAKSNLKPSTEIIGLRTDYAKTSVNKLFGMEHLMALEFNDAITLGLYSYTSDSLSPFSLSMRYALEGL